MLMEDISLTYDEVRGETACQVDNAARRPYDLRLA